jgi:hypothetical protein
LYHRAVKGGSYHGRVSLIQYDLLLFRVGPYQQDIQDQQRRRAGADFLALSHSHSVDQISAAALKGMRESFPDFFARKDIVEKWFASKYDAEITVVRPVVEIEGIDVGFQRASRPDRTVRTALVGTFHMVEERIVIWDQP